MLGDTGCCWLTLDEVWICLLPILAWIPPWLEFFFKVACITGASLAKRGKHGILRLSRFTQNAAFASFGSEALIQGGDPYDAENVLYSMTLYLGTKLNPLVISIKILHVISMLYKTDWWWELRTWSHKIQWVDTSTISHYYFYRKHIGTANRNLNFNIRT